MIWGRRPHLLPARSLLAAHTTPLHQSQQSQLNAKLQTTESQNATLAAEIRAQRAEIAALLGFESGGVRQGLRQWERLFGRGPAVVGSVHGSGRLGSMTTDVGAGPRRRVAFWGLA
ncbi:hypothetical protein BUE80_DR009512 [Diplocarpon rosae]|nr:hypothetical protein BUE80_DR009512 [Diplocarpon rosae]